MTKNSPILIIGFGSIGQKHYQNLLSLGYKNISVFDKSRAAFEDLPKVARLAGFSKRALQDFKIVFVCTPASSHIYYAKMAALAGCHIFVEKPLAASLSGVDGLIKIVNRKKVVAMVACNYLFNRGFKRLYKALKSQRFGKPLLARVTVGYYLPSARKGVDFRKSYAVRNKEGGGVVIDSGSHILLYLQQLFGEVAEITGSKSESDILGIESEEAATIFLRYKNGVVTTAALDFVSKKPVHYIEVVTDKGILLLDIQNDVLVFEDGTKRSLLYKGDKNTNHMFVGELKSFFECVDRKSKPVQSIGEAKGILKMLLKVKKSL